jgi:tartrate-resistant acid phosphatase type 5
MKKINLSICLLISLLQASVNFSFSQRINHTHGIFAIIGDYGFAGPNEAAVANLVKSWTPEFILTVGDNNYTNGEASTIDANIGQYYHDYIKPYIGIYGNEADTNRFFPSLGNHDWIAPSALPYLQYFTLPGNERYYDFIKGDIHFFAIDSDPAEPDGIRSDGVQGKWLRDKLATSPSKWKIVYFHHPPFASDSIHGNEKWMQWPFKQWGADVVVAGHSHIYERLIVDDLPYFVDGLGGQSKYNLISSPVEGSKIRYNGNFGALQVKVSPDTLLFRFYTISNELIDSYPIVKSAVPVQNSIGGEPVLKVYPNPNDGKFTLKINYDHIVEDVEITIFDPIGKKVFEKKVVPVNGHVSEDINIEKEPGNTTYVLNVLIGKKLESAKVMLMEK